MCLILSSIFVSAGTLVDFHVYLSNIPPPVTYPVSHGYTLCATHKGYVGQGETVTLVCNPPGISGQYVYIILPRKHNIHDGLILCEVEVYPQLASK